MQGCSLCAGQASKKTTGNEKGPDPATGLTLFDLLETEKTW
jgi:hypothetical protein